MKEFFKVLLMLITDGYDVELKVPDEEFGEDTVESQSKQEVLLSGTI